MGLAGRGRESEGGLGCKERERETEGCLAAKTQVGWGVREWEGGGEQRTKKLGIKTFFNKNGETRGGRG